jgi:hypothetical protein
MPATIAHVGGFSDPQESNAASARHFSEFGIRAFVMLISPMISDLAKPCRGTRLAAVCG